MVRNPAYARKAPWSDRSGPALPRRRRVEVRPRAGTRVTTLESGETQGIYLVPAQALPRLEKNPAHPRREDAVAGRAAHLAPQHHQAALDDVRVRRAINYAVDKEAFLATVYKGTGLKAFAPLTAVMLDDPALRQAYPHDPARAQALLGEAGWAPGGGRHPDQGRPAARDRPERHRVRRRGRPDRPAHPVLAARRRHRREDQGPGAAAVVRGQLPLRHPRPGDVPALHRSGRPLRAVPLVARRRQLQLVVREERQARRDAGGGAPRVRSRQAPRRSTSPSRSSRSTRRSPCPSSTSSSVWAFRANVQGTKYNFNAYPVLSDVVLRK